jgi:hypothetical protein
MMLDAFEGAPNIIHVSTVGSDTDPAHNGSSWAKAYATIGKALAPNGRPKSNITVLVAPGEYDEVFTILGSNVSIIGSGMATRIASNPESPEITGVANTRGNNVTFQDLQIVNTRPDGGSFKKNGISFDTTQAATVDNISIIRCVAHGEVGVFLLTGRNLLLIDGIYSGFENASVLGNSPNFEPISSYTQICSNTIKRIAPVVDRDSPAIHLLRGGLTMMNSSMGAVAQAPDLSAEYRGLLLDGGSCRCLVFGCTIGTSGAPDAHYDGATFDAITGNGPGVFVSVAACIVRAVGIPGGNDAKSFDTIGEPVAIQNAWNLTIPPFNG